MDICSELQETIKNSQQQRKATMEYLRQINRELSIKKVKKNLHNKI